MTLSDAVYGINEAVCIKKNDGITPLMMHGLAKIFV